MDPVSTELVRLPRPANAAPLLFIQFRHQLDSVIPLHSDDDFNAHEPRMEQGVSLSGLYSVDLLFYRNRTKFWLSPRVSL